MATKRYVLDTYSSLSVLRVALVSDKFWPFFVGQALLLLLSQWLCWTIGIIISLFSLCYCQECFTCYCGRIASFTKPPAIFRLCFTSNFWAKSHHFSHCKAILQHSLGCYGTLHSDQWRSWHNLPFFSDTRNKKSIEPLSLVLPYDCNILVHYKNWLYNF